MHYNQTIETQRNDNMSQVTLRKGYWFYFDHKGNDISMHGSAWSGKETVYFNNKAVSSFRNISKRKSEHTFTENGHSYRVATNMEDMLRGTLIVSLYCDEELIKTESVTYSEKGSFTKGFFKHLLIGGAVGFVFGALIAHFDLINRFWG
jgi:hypothetical protein